MINKIFPLWNGKEEERRKRERISPFSRFTFMQNYTSFYHLVHFDGRVCASNPLVERICCEFKSVPITIDRCYGWDVVDGCRTVEWFILFWPRSRSLICCGYRLFWCDAATSSVQCTCIYSIRDKHLSGAKNKQHKMNRSDRSTPILIAVI